ncbi:helix-turn-helix transcriptional regulator [Xanthomonas campestris pv. campestris]|uniref:helix-turn-helix transcriptional regulator n=1 Tax=Xanthomonas campestris TaxID=339 RepID=UPI001A15F215|nr:helix-turn-helix transcriptional regulator [Xanthomonas campestris]MBF9173306.1 helix-turn-helix transcriptional regulator [Xanthomonas campestris pv. campestris]MDO0848583.1 helix-turn-helix transcriptional regulator [Xanthomonas campestris pv. campestris]MEB1416047.1 helix-turn-helix transcriptional regulator [Xanthomonas campestris pv. campestris]MEB1461793.1 helix-turn-helix transcriptional regulator [Xanthomonas campestris pv. campestris]MEB1502844.1 helix-turn-helix transcriptional re
MSSACEPTAPLAPPPQSSNRRQLQQIITGLSEGVILVEPDQTITWANEAALAMHGASDLAELGATVSDYRARFQLRYRNNHRLNAGNYPIDRVIAGEVFNDVVVEVVRADTDAQWVHRVRSLVLTDAQGAPDCLVLIVADASDWASAEQRFERTFNANPAPAVICRLADQRYIKVNQGFVEMTGYTREAVVGKSVFEVDVLELAERRELALERLNEGATIPQMQAELSLPDGSTKMVVVAGQPIEIGEEACMLFTFMDLEPRRRAEVALRQSEERFAKAFRITPVPTLICNAETLQIVEINDAVSQTTQYASEDIMGKFIDEIGLLATRQAYQQFCHALAESGSMLNVEYAIARKDGEPLDCLVSAETVSIHGVQCYLVSLMDITDRKRTEMELVTAIEAVMQDASWFSQTLLEKLANVRRANRPSQAHGCGVADLTGRERDVLGLLAEGLADKEIAQQLGVSPNTVRNHVAALYSKIDVHSRGEAIVWARERGFAGRPAKKPARKP